MKRLIIPIVVALLAGIGGGSGYAYMHTSPIVAADSAAHDSTAHDSTAAKGAHDSTGAAKDAAIVDSMHAADSAASTDTTSHAEAMPMTPADSIRALQTARTTLKAEGKPVAHGEAPVGASRALIPPGAKPVDVKPAVSKAGESKAADAKAVPATSTQQAAELVRSARNEALNTALPEQRLAKIFGAMQAKDAAKVLEQMTDSDIRAILGLMGDRQAAAIIATFPAQRAATIARGGSRAPGSTP